MVRSVQGQVSLSYNYDSEIEQAATGRCYCLKIKRTDGTIYGFTENTEDIAFDLGDGDGEITYQYVDTIGIKGDIQHRSGLAVDGETVAGILSDSNVTEDDVQAGLFDFAECVLFSVIFDDLDAGARIHRSGWLGEIKLSDGLYESELRGLRQALGQRIVELFTPGCRANLGDERCGVPLTPIEWPANTAVDAATAFSGCTLAAQAAGTYQPADLRNSTVFKPSVENGWWFVVTVSGTTAASEPTWNLGLGNTTTDSNGVVYQAIPAYVQSGTVLSVISRKAFETDIDAFYGTLSDVWRGGIVTWTSGANTGTTWEIARDLTDNSPASLLLYLPTGKPIQVGDTFSITMGCDKQLETCTLKFRNTFNFRGEPYVPGTDVQLTYPDGN